jgi:peptidoglycan/xylan/chitin deacetylase (PgdA/CDA1 family)
MRKSRKRAGKWGILLMLGVMIVLVVGCSAGVALGLSALGPVDGKKAPAEEVLSGGGTLNEEEPGKQVEAPGKNETAGETAEYVPGKDVAGIKPGAHTDGNSSGEKPSSETSGKPTVEKPSSETGGKPAVEKPTGESSGKPSSEKPAGGTSNKPPGSATAEKPGSAGNKPQQTGGKIALTFDDGPDTRYTTAILDILKEKNVKATFFVVGSQVKKYPDVLKRIVEEGHAIGNHSQNHKDLSKLTKEQIAKEIDLADAAIEDVLGYKPELFRAPYGALSQSLKKTLKEKDRKLVGWTVDTRDWAGTSIKDMRKVISNGSKPNGIILMHSFGGKHIANTVKMLPDVIDDLTKQGYTFVTADELVE